MIVFRMHLFFYLAARHFEVHFSLLRSIALLPLICFFAMVFFKTFKYEYKSVQYLFCYTVSSNTFEPCFFILVNFRHSKVQVQYLLNSLINFKTICFNILLYADFYKDIRNEKFLTENRQYFFSSKSFLNFGGPSTKFLINEFLIKKKACTLTCNPKQIILYVTTLKYF